MKHSCGMKPWRLASLLLAALLLSGCAGIFGSTCPVDTPCDQQAEGPGAAGAVIVQGNLTGDAAPLPGPVSVALVDETANVAASQTVTADNGNFTLVAPTGRSYMILFRDGGPAGKTICALIVDRQTNRVAFSLPSGSPDTNLGPVIINVQEGKAWCRTDPPLVRTAVAFPSDMIQKETTLKTQADGAPGPLAQAGAFAGQANIPGPAGEAAPGAVTFRGNLVGDAAAILTGAQLEGVAPVPGTPASVPLTGPVSVVLADETGSVAASQTVTADDGNFALIVPAGHSYMMLFRDGNPMGKTLAPLIVDRQTQRVAFSLPEGAPDVNLGSVTMDSQLGRAWSETDPPLALTDLAFPWDRIEWRGRSDIPTEGQPSPLFGARPFTQQMVLFEEFGAEAMPAGTANFFPLPVNAQSGPDPAELEAFLALNVIAPAPTRLANVVDVNPWKREIEAFIGHPLVQPPEGVAGPAEGRPPGEDWAHQSWTEFFPQKFFKTAQAGARVNGGFRDAKQRHGYRAGEFARGGLYHNTAGLPATEGTTRGIAIRLHPAMPVQDPNSVWTFDGTLPPKLLLVRYGEPVLMRHYNALPIDETASNGFGTHTLATHEHNGHQPGESDGFTGGFFFPGQFHDYRWPLQLAGFSNNNNPTGAINYSATEPRAALPCEPGEMLPVLVNGVLTMKACDAYGRINIPGDWRETMSSHWFHDHMHEFTSENVYKGNAAMMNYYSALDRGNEAVSDGVNLRFPSGTALNWGNRDYDVNLVVADKAADQAGQLWMNTLQRDGFLGDIMTVNWQFKPYLDVRARSYRFRFLNGAVARIMAIALVQEVAGDGGELPGPAGSGVSYNRVPFHMIANDGNIMGHAVPFDGKMDLGIGKPDDWKGQLPSLSIGERYDIVVNFGAYGIRPGDNLYFVNVLEHQDGKGSKGKVPLADVLSGKYNPVVGEGRWINGDPGVGKFLELRVKAYAGTDLSMNPADFEPGKAVMIPLPIDRHDPALAKARRHTFDFVRSEGGHGAPWQIKVDGGDADIADTHRISAIEQGDTEIWRFTSAGGWTHPVHVHFEESVILTRGGKTPPEWEKWARKDMFRVGPENDSTGTLEIIFRARDFLGHYVAHCHNTTHEDHAMLLRWDARHKKSRLADTPMPTFDGVFFEPSFALPLADVGDGTGPKAEIREDQP